jgi:hypothetical protein
MPYSKKLISAANVLTDFDASFVLDQCDKLLLFFVFFFFIVLAHQNNSL